MGREIPSTGVFSVKEGEQNKHWQRETERKTAAYTCGGLGLGCFQLVFRFFFVFLSHPPRTV